MKYPISLIQSFKRGEITKPQFMKFFSDWQKSNGINFDCKGIVEHGYVGVAYRSVNAVIRGNKLYFVTDRYTDKKGNLRYKMEKANSVFEFRRKVDFYRLREAKWI